MTSRFLTDRGFLINATSTGEARAIASRDGLGVTVWPAPSPEEILQWSIFGAAPNDVRAAASRLQAARRILANVRADLETSSRVAAEAASIFPGVWLPCLRYGQPAAVLADGSGYASGTPGGDVRIVNKSTSDEDIVTAEDAVSAAEAGVVEAEAGVAAAKTALTPEQRRAAEKQARIDSYLREQEERKARERAEREARREAERAQRKARLRAAEEARRARWAAEETARAEAEALARAEREAAEAAERAEAEARAEAERMANSPFAVLAGLRGKLRT